MIRPSLLLGMWLLAVPAHVLGQEPDEAARLRQQIELLKKEVDLLKRENALLKKENDDLRKATAVPKASTRKAELAKALSDVLTEGTVLPGTYIASSRRSGICTLTIKERNGNKFKGVLFHQLKDDQGKGEEHAGEVEGTITANGVSFRRIGSPVQALFTGQRKGEYLEIDGAGGLGGSAKVSVKLPK
jgi:hypothetical protein